MISPLRIWALRQQLAVLKRSQTRLKMVAESSLRHIALQPCRSRMLCFGLML